MRSVEVDLLGVDMTIEVDDAHFLSPDGGRRRARWEKRIE